MESEGKRGGDGMKKWLNQISLGNAKQLLRPVLWQVLATIFEAMPYGFTLIILLEYVGALKEQRALQLPLLIGQCVGIAITTMLLYFINKRAYVSSSDIGCYVQEEAQRKLVQHMRKLSMGFFAGHDPGNLSNLVVQDSSNLNNMIARLLPKMTAGFIFPVMGLLFLIFLDWKMTFAMLITLLVSVPLIFLARYLVGRLGRKQTKAMNEATSRMLEYIGGIREIKAYNLGGGKFESLKNSFEQLKKASILQEALAGPSISLSSIVLHAVLPVMMLLGSYDLIGGRITAEVFLIFLIMGMRIGDPLLMAYTFLAEITFYGLSAARIHEVMEISPLPEPLEGKAIESSSISFQDVKFAYHTDKAPVLKKISFQVPEHTMTALVGPSGSGKSTITKLIARFWDTDSGQVCIGGTPLTQLQGEQLLAKVAMVFQEVYLFRDTIRNNIAMGRPGATLEEVMEAAKLAACHDFILKMPSGYDTIIGEGGGTLSGGEKQRISIARAILKDAKIILLDEATASLDPENEVHVQKALSNLVKNRTIVVIAHKLQSIKAAEQILVLHDGEIIEKGRHHELIERQGLYNDMWREQSRAKSWKFK